MFPSSKVYPHFRGGIVKNYAEYNRQGSNPNLPIIGNIVYCEADALDHAATEAGVDKCEIFSRNLETSGNFLASRRGTLDVTPFGVITRERSSWQSAVVCDKFQTERTRRYEICEKQQAYMTPGDKPWTTYLALEELQDSPEDVTKYLKEEYLRTEHGTAAPQEDEDLTDEVVPVEFLVKRASNLGSRPSGIRSPAPNLPISSKADYMTLSFSSLFGQASQVFHLQSLHA
uniref:Uncharacterized protein n=1 Tax=Timema monikensis TaxID=170555 RepID=A0A7R9EAZ6_9NEOP|nr:unnamed protein product [Timema monikensis]